MSAEFSKTLVLYSGSSGDDSDYETPSLVPILNTDDKQKHCKLKRSHLDDTEGSSTANKFAKPSSPCNVSLPVADDTNVSKTNEHRKSNLSLLPPVPKDITSMFQDEGELGHEDPSKHDGRVRTFAHERGNWATFLYIPEEKSPDMCCLVEELMECLPDQTEWHMCDDFHVSLSRTVTIRHHWIDPLMNSLREKLQYCGRCACEWSSIEVYTNDDKTRSFLSLKVDYGQSDLVDVVKVIDGCFTEYNLPKYYQPPSFHVSVCWALGDVTANIDLPIKTKLQTTLDNFISTNEDINSLLVEDVWCSTGNKTYKFALGSR